MATDVRNTGNNNAAAEAARRAAEAAEAARRAAEAARRAAEARAQAEQARQAQESASKNAEGAARNLGESRKDLVHGQQQLENARPEQRDAAKKNVERLKGEVDSAREKLKSANRELRDAETKLQKAQVEVVRQARTAQEAMLKANSTAKKDPLNALNPFKPNEPFSQEDISKVGPTANEIRDVYETTDGAMRDEVARKLGEELGEEAVAQGGKKIGEAATEEASRRGIEGLADGAKLGEQAGRAALENGARRGLEKLSDGERLGKKAGEAVLKDGARRGLQGIADGEKLGEQVGRASLEDGARRGLEKLVDGKRLGEQAGRAAVEDGVRRGLGGLADPRDLGAQVFGRKKVQPDRGFVNGTDGSRDKDAVTVKDAAARQETDDPKKPEGLGKREGRELANRAADRAEANLEGELKGKKLSEIPPHVADRELKAALKEEAKERGINANDLKALEGKGKDSEKAKDFAAAYAEEARNTLKDRLGGNAELVLNGGAGRELATTAKDQTHRAAKIAFNDKTADAAGEVAGKKGFVEHSPKKQQELAQQRIDAARAHVADKLDSGDRATKDKARLELAQLLNEEVGNLPRAEREKLLEDNKEMLSEISAGANGKPEEKYRRGILRELNQTAEAAGPDGTKIIAKEFAKNVINQHTDVDNKDQLGGAWKQSIKDGDGAALALAVAGELKGKGLDEARDNILKGTREGIRDVRNAFAKKAERINELETQYHEIVTRYGTDKKGLKHALEEFKKDNAKLYKEFEETGEKAASVLEGAGAALRGKDIPKDLRNEAINLLGQTPEIGKTNAGREALSNALALSGQGKPNVLDSIHEAGQEIYESNPDFSPGEFEEAVSEQAIAGAGLKIVSSGVDTLKGGGEADLVLKGLVQQHKLLGATKDEIKQVASGLRRTFTGDKGGIEDVAQATGGKTGKGWSGTERTSQALKGLGLALSIPNAVKDIGKIGDGDAKLTERIKATAGTLGLGADGAGLALDVFGRADQLKVLPKLLGGVSAGAGVVTSILDGIEGIKQINKGDTYQGAGKVLGATGGLLASTGALLTLATASQAAPIVGQVGVALAASAVLVSSGLKAADEAADRQEKLEDTQRRAKDILVDLGFNPEVAEKFADKEPELRMFLDDLRKETGLSQKELATKLKKLTPEQAEEFIEVNEHVTPGWYQDARRHNENQRLQNEEAGLDPNWNLPFPNLDRPRYDRNSTIQDLPDPYSGSEWEQHPQRPKDIKDAANYLRARGLI